jgi:predicted neuraminidase
VAVVSGDYLVAYCRRGGGYDPAEKGYVVRAESHDGGRTWSRGVDSQFPNPNSAVDFLRLASGNMLLIYNRSMNQRTPLSAALSTDGDRTYPYRRDLLTGEGPFAYPFVVQGRDGRIHMVFTTEERTVIQHAEFREDEVREETSR